MRHPRLKVGDRVHYPEAPTDTGTVIENCVIAVTSRGKRRSRRLVTIEWDVPQPGAVLKDCDHATQNGNLNYMARRSEGEPIFVVRIDKENQ